MSSTSSNRPQFNSYDSTTSSISSSTPSTPSRLDREFDSDLETPLSTPSSILSSSAKSPYSPSPSTDTATLTPTQTPTSPTSPTRTMSSSEQTIDIESVNKDLQSINLESSRPTIVAEGGGPLDTIEEKLSSPRPEPSSSSETQTPSPSPAPVPSTSQTTPSNAPPTTLPPPLVPRQSAPASSSALKSPTQQQQVPLRRPPAGGNALKAGVRGSAGGSGGPLKMPPSLAAKMAAMTSRTSSSGGPSGSGTPPIPSLKPSNPPQPPQPGTQPPALAPRPPPRTVGAATAGSAPPPRTGALAGRPGQGGMGIGGMAARRKGMGAGLTLSAMGVGGGAGGEEKKSRGPPGGMKLNLNGEGGIDGTRGEGQGEGVGSPNGTGNTDAMGTPFSNFRKIVDPSGRLNFAQKAILHADGVDFSSGASFKIKMDDFELFEELGKGNYGTVQKVLHRPTAVTMALKEIRLELDDSKLKTIITELDILHRATSPYIIDFYGAFFIESCVYYCMEFMDAGSLEVVAGIDVPEDVLARITRSMVEGLKFLKDGLKIMHRDVKPTNVLLNRNGSVKLCDFGVSGQLDRSLAKTNIGCQSYMAPERIKGEAQGGATSYTASSDVWSLGLSIIEAAIGHYPYPPETYSNVFAQLTAIVHGDPPSLPDRYSETARDFVAKCLEKQANRRPTYAQLLEHPWLKDDKEKDVDMVGWIAKALDYREKNPRISAPALA